MITNGPAFVDVLLEVVAAEAGRTVRMLLSRKLELYVCKFRDTAIYLARVNTDLSWEALAARFGARHHSTLICAFHREESRLQRPTPRKDKRTQAEWHAYLLDKVRAQLEKGDAHA